MVKSFLNNAVVHQSLRLFAKHAGSFVLICMGLFFLTWMFSGKEELDAMLTALPLLVLALPGVAVLAMQTTYEVIEGTK